MKTTKTTKTKITERETLESWIEQNDRYQFLCMLGEKEPLAKLRKAKAATEAIDTILRVAAKQIQKVANKYRSMGIIRRRMRQLPINFMDTFTNASSHNHN